ncbi:elongation factor P maturation arginine rhamnosyltransferase EarP [Pseudomonas asuensis]|uniref:Protein-arginine rhamnosyltransferase n=1 Tax=Pseudomonas asuensis TaxID=1825787 RepID=A0ABQ2GMA2_9PSED|nr:elongation factor P maturation arginine rhamnosyltransferase EarP [Pseudomonas asuensis]GGM02304.1 hypothetical protein GCM10009425_12000 [Pseudomonas asuensis]
MNASWDIFCSVVDNYGDIGVTWRLARQLVVEHGQQVRLWVDDWPSFARIHPAGRISDAPVQQHLGVEVHHWTANWPEEVIPADVVVEAFGCPLPEPYVQAMARRTSKPLWINLEYLSAEGWIESCHRLPSPQQGLQKYFFFPGFTGGTGGLLRERDLLARRARFQASAEARACFLATLGITQRPDERVFSLFSYEIPTLADWLHELAEDAVPTLLLIPEGRVLGSVACWLGTEALQAGDEYRRGSLRLSVVPFRQQDDYDLLLWCCDFNAARGEESFIRAQWAGRPFIWHIYPQEKRAHMLKLDAFLDRYLEGLSPAAQAATRALWHAWNGEGALGKAWREWSKWEPEMTAHAENWCARQSELNDLASTLVQFHAERLLYGA